MRAELTQRPRGRERRTKIPADRNAFWIFCAVMTGFRLKKDVQLAPEVACGGSCHLEQTQEAWLSHVLPGRPPEGLTSRD